MAVLSDHQIRKATSKRTLVIEPFSEQLLHPASYDLTVGSKALKSTKADNPVVNLEVERILTIGTGEFVEVLTKERLEMPLDLCARFGLRSYFTRKGLIMFGGPQIDPGFKGNLVVSMFNTGPRPIVLKYGEDFCTVEFSRLEEPSEKGYSGAYQGVADFPSDNIEFIVGAKGVTLYEVVDVMKGLKSDVKWMKYILALILAGILAELFRGFFH